jgi:hypothetical protein
VKALLHTWSQYQQPVVMTTTRRILINEPIARRLLLHGAFTQLAEPTFRDFSQNSRFSGPQCTAR